jgi:predicted adenylyl cyclase CyaB
MSAEFMEVETKYAADDIARMKFKTLMTALGARRFLYVEGRDRYYVRENSDFLRYRMPAISGGDKRSELTFKKKSIRANNNIRLEVNLRVDANNADTVDAFCQGLGYEFNFSIVKFCDIYYFDRVNVVYYTVCDDETDKMQSFIEIEANENEFASTAEAWDAVSEYEKKLAPLGITAQHRLKKSLFEIFVRRPR